jgi:hypothetical protein
VAPLRRDSGPPWRLMTWGMGPFGTTRTWFRKGATDGPPGLQNSAHFVPCRSDIFRIFQQARTVKAPITFEALFQAEDLIQEVKSGNPDLASQ